MRSLSNVIKAYSVRYDEEAKKTIDTHFKLDKEIEAKQSSAVLKTEIQEEFVEGLNAIVIEALPTPEETSEKASKIIEEANEEAKILLEKAQKEAEQVKKDAFAAAQKKGYEEGNLKAKQETQRLAAEYDEKAVKLQKEYEDMALSLEPVMAEIISDLVQKITGIIVEDKEEVILYLINKSIKNFEKCDDYTIKVSKDDFDYVSSKKDAILKAIGREVHLNVVEDDNLTDNQCLIETDMRAINCSLDVQLNNLITDLKLIGRL